MENTVRKSLPIGNDDFKKLIESGFYYVDDKTLMIKDIIDNIAEVQLYTSATFQKIPQHEYAQTRKCKNLQKPSRQRQSRCCCRSHIDDRSVVLSLNPIRIICGYNHNKRHCYGVS